MYKNLTPEEKATWEARAQQDKARYEAELAAYVPPPGHNAKGVLIEQQRPRKRNKRNPRDPDAPKRASGAYVFFTNDMRPKVLQEFPGIKFVELGKVLGERWRALTPDEKKRYEDMAAQDKIRFQVQMQEYTAQQMPATPASVPTEPQYYYDQHHPTTVASLTDAFDAAANEQHHHHHQPHFATTPPSPQDVKYHTG